MTRIVLHIGLHKTGTTSFQQACFKNRDLLRSHGVLYPDQRDFTYDTVQHLGLVTALRNDAGCVQDMIGRLAKISAGYETLLLSSEDFSHFFGGEVHEAASHEALKALRSAFADVRFICVIRDDRAILRSSLREMIEGMGFPARGTAFVRQQIASFYKRNHRISQTLRDHLTVLSYEELAQGNMANALLCAAIGADLGVHNEIAHTSANKDARTIIMGSIRMLLFNAEAASNPYTNEINQKLAGVVRGISINRDSGQQIEDAFNRWLDRELDSALADTAMPLAKIYRDRLPR